MTVQDILETMDYGPAPESPGAAIAWLDAHQRNFGHFIGGEWKSAEQSFATQNPSTGEELARIAQGTPGDINDAVQAASEALPSWQALSGAERGRYLYALGRQIQKHSRLFAVLESLDNGKPIRESRDIDIPLVARHFHHHAGWAQIRDEEFPGYEPVGVCGQIIPWNFPLLMLAWKIAPALAMGNTVILKPAEFTSLTALLFAEICQNIKLPAGVVNVVTGDGATGSALVEHTEVHKIAFTGSTEVGRILRRATAGSGKKLSLELGGKSPFILFADADLDAAVEGIVDAIWFNQGQVCCAGSRLLVQESVADRLLTKLKARMESLRLGHSLDKAIDVGAIIDPTQRERIDALVKTGVSEGAALHQVGDCPTSGCFYPPTLLSGVSPASTVAQVEIFGPVLVSMTFRTPDEAVALANNTVYGLAASVWSENLNVAHHIAARIQAGVVWVNCTNQFDAAAGFGGYRESGFGREGGREGLYEYLKPNIAKAAHAEAPIVGAKSAIDVTHKLYIGGKQARPDGGYSFAIGNEEFASANRKDVRNAVEAARAAQSSWGVTSGHLRSQIIYYLAENLQKERSAFAISDAEFDASLERITYWASRADKLEGVIHDVPLRGLISARPEPLGTVGVTVPEDPGLLGYLSATLPLIAHGNSVVSVASRTHPHAAAQLVRVLEASDIPSGVWNILTADSDEPALTLVHHRDVAAFWHFGHDDLIKKVEELSAEDLKQTWCPGSMLDWFARPHREFSRRATQIKNVWVPFGA